MTSDQKRKLIGGTSLGAGLVYSVAMLLKPIQVVAQGQADLVLALNLLPVMIPGLLFLYFGWSFYHEVTVRSLKGILGTAAVFGVLLVSSSLTVLFSGPISEQALGFMLIFLFTLIALPLYIMGVRWLMSQFYSEVPSKWSFIGRKILILLSWELWIMLFVLFREYGPPGESPWRFMSVLAPVAIAYGAFQLGIRKLKKHQSS